MIDINEYMKREDSSLAKYASRNSESRGRKYPQRKHPYRPPYERDRERVIHSNSFRRLTYKTQVFVNHEGDHYRTRLTHTLETATIARSIATALNLNTDLTEAISLSHDLGHTPFGHTGEEVLNELLCDAGGFEHNRQSLRVVDYLEKRYPEFDGLNLTFETREGIQKHVTRYDSAGANGEFDTRWPSLEGQVVCAADEIAFMCHDLDDGIYSGLLDAREIETCLPLWAELADRAREEYSGLKGELLRKAVIRKLINLEVTDVIIESDSRLIRLDLENTLEIREAPKQFVAHSEPIATQNEIINSYLREKLYRHYMVLRMSTKTRMIIESLFKVYVDNPRQLPEDMQNRLETEDPRIIVADYIAGMTDRYAMIEYKKLFDPFEKML